MSLIRDAIKFPDVIQALKPDPITFRQEPNRIFDFMSQTPECMHMLTNLFSPRGIPASYRHQQGFGVNTYKMVNAEGNTVLVKYHWHPRCGVASLTANEAQPLAGQLLTDEDTRRLQKLGANGDAIDLKAWGTWIASVPNREATAEEVLDGMPGVALAR